MFDKIQYSLQSFLLKCESIYTFAIALSLISSSVQFIYSGKRSSPISSSANSSSLMAPPRFPALVRGRSGAGPNGSLYDVSILVIGVGLNSFKDSSSSSKRFPPDDLRSLEGSLPLTAEPGTDNCPPRDDPSLDDGCLEPMGDDTPSAIS